MIKVCLLTPLAVPTIFFDKLFEISVGYFSRQIKGQSGSATEQDFVVSCLRARLVGDLIFHWLVVRLVSYGSPTSAKMGTDGYRSLRSPGAGTHVTRFGRQVTASPVFPSQVKPLHHFYGNLMDWYHFFKWAVFKHISRLLSPNGDNWLCPRI